MAQVQLEYELYEHHLVAACLPPSATLLHVFEYCPLWSERWKKPSKPFSNCTYWQPELAKKQRALSRTNQLQGIFSGQHSLLNYTCPRRVDEFNFGIYFSLVQTKTEPMQEKTLRKLHCASCLLVFCVVGAAGVGGEVSEETIQTYLYSNCAFHHQI